MIITAVDVVRVQVPAVEPAFVWRDGLPGSEPATEGAWLLIRTDEGVTGLSFAPRGVVVEDYVNRRLRTELIGQDPLAREHLWHRVWEMDRIERFPVAVQGIVDVALWDLAAKSVDLPLYKLLGSARESVPAYASTVTFATTEAFLDVADQCLELGYPAIKLHAWGDARRDAALCLALRDHVGPDVPLMYDGSAGFDLMDAVYVGKALGDAGYLWYEEPMKEFSVTAYKWLGERVDVPLLVAEVAEGVHMNTADFIASGCASGVRTDAELRGGITGAMRVAHLADSFLLRAEVHGSGIVSRHLCMAINNNSYYEALIESTTVADCRPEVVQGVLHAPTLPGVGYEEAWLDDEMPIELTKELSR
jgi:L-alanine-DL-glutamate epimerase-like enolase superfamily enzyme